VDEKDKVNQVDFVDKVDRVDEVDKGDEMNNCGRDDYVSRGEAGVPPHPGHAE
jgi:hypothetical protein